MADSAERQEQLYRDAAGAYGAALERLARAYEPDADRRRDLLQEIHVALWRSLASFAGRCSLRTWVYLVAHNVASSQVRRRRAGTPTLVNLEDVVFTADEHGTEQAFDRRMALDRLLALIETLKPLDRLVIVLYLEGVDAASIGEIAISTHGDRRAGCPPAWRWRPRWIFTAKSSSVSVSCFGVSGPGTCFRSSRAVR